MQGYVDMLHVHLLYHHVHCCDIGAFASSKIIHLLLWQYHRMPFPVSLLPLMAVCIAHGTAG